MRGSVFIEFLFFVPVAVLVWTLMTFIYDAKRTAVVTQKAARECAWEYALHGCSGGLPPECRGASPRLVPDVLLRAAARRSFMKIAQKVPLTAANFSNLHGRSFSLQTEKEVQRPVVLGGSTTAEGRFATMCADDPLVKWQTPVVFTMVCKDHGHSPWCP